MAATPIPFSSKDNSEGALNAGISPSATSIVLESGDGANFPQPYTGSATSGGTSTTLNSTGVLAIIGSGSVGKFLWNKTDGSVGVITNVATNAVTTTRLLGGTDNTWDNADVWSLDPFVVTFAVVNDDEEITQYEEALITARSTDTLTVPASGRGYNGTIANTFSAGDAVYLFSTSPIVERAKDIIAVLGVQVNTNVTNIAAIISNLASTADSLGASLIGVEDDGAYYAAANVEAVLQEVGASLATKVGLANVGFYGDGSDSAPTWTSGASLDPSTEKRYTTATLPISQTLTVSSVNSVLVIHNTGSVTINGTVDMDGKGGAGGTAGTASFGDGATGTNGASRITDADFLLTVFRTGGGTGGAGDVGAGGGGGASGFRAGSDAAAGGTPGTGGTVMADVGFAFLSSILRCVVCGSGGGGGEGGGTSRPGGVGARGAGRWCG